MNEYTYTITPIQDTCVYFTNYGGMSSAFGRDGSTYTSVSYDDKGDIVVGSVFESTCDGETCLVTFRMKN